MFINGCRVPPLAQSITIGSLALVVTNLICANVSSTISLIPFEDVWIEDTYACVFVIILGGQRGGRRVLEKLSLMMFPADTVNDSHVSNRTEFMW